MNSENFFQKEKFDTQIKELWVTQGKNAGMFFDSECKEFIENVKKKVEQRVTECSLQNFTC